MVFFSDYFLHKRDCQRKQQERDQRVQDVYRRYPPKAILQDDRQILDAPIQDLVSGVQNKTVSPLDILRTYGKAAMLAHERTNCLTEIMLPEAEEWATKECNLSGPLAGIPISLKDTIVCKGFDTSVGFSSKTGKPYSEDGIMVKILKQAGAVPFMKTNVPVSLLSFESTNELWGRCKNPHNTDYSPGGSTGGEGALLALGGSRIGIGSDVAGSVRAPAHFSGCYSLRCSVGRWPKLGMDTSMPGQEGVMAVFSPMARTLNDLVYFTRSLISMDLWRMDYSILPIPWRHEVENDIHDQKRLRIGVLRTDGVVDPAPACARALEETVAALKADGHDVFDVDPPANATPYEGLRIASALLNSDGCRTLHQFYRTGEWNDAGAAQMLFYFRLPRPIKYLHYLWVKYVQRDDVWAGLLEQWTEKSAFQQWKLVARREAYRGAWHAWWTEQVRADCILTPPNATPAVPHDGMHDAVSSCGYTFLFNLLDYTAGVLPVTHVDRTRDYLPAHFSTRGLNGVARGAYKHYDAGKMHGLPVGVQVVGQRLTEERVLALMERIEDSLDRHNGGRYELLELD